MTNYSGPDGFTAHCSNCGQLKIRHSFVGSRCPGTFEQGPVVRQEMDLGVDEPAVISQDELDAIRAASTEDHYGPELMRTLDGIMDDVDRIYDAKAAAKELVAYLDTEFEGNCWDCCTPEGHPHSPECRYVGLKERILAAP